MNPERYDILKKLYEKNALSDDVMQDLKTLEEKGFLSNGLESLSDNDDYINRLVEENKQPSVEEEIISGLGRGTRGVMEGAAQWGGVLFDPMSWAVTQALNAITDQDKKPIVAKEAVKNILDQAGIPEAETKAQRIIQQGIEFSTGAGLDVLSGRAAGKVLTGTGQEIAKQFAAQPAQQIAAAGASGIAQQAAAEEGAGTFGQTAAALAGGMAGAKLSQPRQIKPRTVQPGLEEAEEMGMDVFTTDVVKPRSFFPKMVQSIGEKIPVFGMGGRRATQYEQRLDAIKSVLRKYNADDELIDMSNDIMKELSKQRKADLTKYTGIKKNVVNKMENFGDVPVPNTLAKIDSEIERLNKIDPKLNKPAVDILNSYKKAFQNKTFLNIDGIREMLGEAFTPNDLATVKKQAEKSVNRIYGAIKEDMGNFIKTHGDTSDFHKWNQSNKRLSFMMNEFKISGLKAALKKGDVTPETVNKLLFSHNKSEVKALYRNLTDSGKKNAKTAILVKALEKSNGLDNLSAEKFTSNLNRLGRSIGVFFEGRELRQVEGLARALKLTEQSAKAGLHPSTGVQSTPYVIGAVLADLFGGTFGGSLVGMAGIGGITQAIESKPVRNILMKIPTLKKGSKEEAALVKRLIPILREEINKAKEEQSQ